MLMQPEKVLAPPPTGGSGPRMRLRPWASLLGEPRPPRQAAAAPPSPSQPGAVPVRPAEKKGLVFHLLW